MQPTTGVAVARSQPRAGGYQWNEAAQHGWGEPRRGRQSGARQSAGRRAGPGADRQPVSRGRSTRPGRGAARPERRGQPPPGQGPERATGRSSGPRACSPRSDTCLSCISAVLAVVAGVGAYTVYYHFEGNITSVKVGGLSGRTDLRVPQHPRAGLAGTQGPARLLRLRGQPGHDELRQPAAGPPGPDAHARDRAVDPAGPVRLRAGLQGALLRRHRRLAGPELPAGRHHRRRAQHRRPDLRGRRPSRP